MDIIKKHTVEHINFPKEGVIFRDLMTLMTNVEDRNIFFNFVAKIYHDKIDVICGLDSRGYFYSILAEKMNLPFLPIRKRSGKVPNTIFKYYKSEYGSACLEVQKDLIKELPKNCRILLVDDLLATGGSLLASIQILEKAGCKVSYIMCPIELLGLDGRKNLKNIDFTSFYKVPYNFTKDEFSQLVSDGHHLALKLRYQELEYKISDYIKIMASGFDLSDRIENLNDDKLRMDLILKESTVLGKFVDKINYGYNSTEHDNRIILFYHYDMKDIAINIANSYPNNFRLGKINWDYFPDTWYNISFETPLINKHVVFLGTLCDPKKFLENAMFSVVFPRQHVKSFTYVIPYFAPATMERVQKEGILASAEPLAKLLTGSIQDTKGGACTLKIYDIHALPVRFYFNDTCISKQLTAISLIKNIIKKDMLTVCFPDDGAFKRYAQDFTGFPIITCSKQRIGDRRIVTISDEYNFNSNHHMEHVIIIDDLVQSGGTLNECRKALQTRGFKKISCYVTHAVFPNESYTEFMQNGNKQGFEKFYVTNTNPMITCKLNEEPFVVLNIDDHLAEDIMQDLEIKKCTEYKPLKIIVGSTNKIKLDAVNLAMNKINSNRTSKYLVNICGYDVKSDVNNQPIGENEIYKGATNRLKNLDAHTFGNPLQTIQIAIENGYIHGSTSYSPKLNSIGYDIAYVRAKCGDKIMDSPSERVYIDQKDSDIINDSLVDQSITIGSKLEKKYGYPEGQWHEYYSGMSRLDQIVGPVERVLREILE